MPTLVHNGAAIRESTLICDYVDELYPDPPLKAAAPVARAYARMDRGSGRARPRARRLAFLRRDLPGQADGHAGRRAQRLPGRPDGARTHSAAAVPRFTPNQPTEHPSFTHCPELLSIAEDRICLYSSATAPRMSTSACDQPAVPVRHPGLARQLAALRMIDPRAPRWRLGGIPIARNFRARRDCQTNRRRAWPRLH